MRRICTVILLSLLTTSTLFAQESNSRAQSKAQLIERVTIRGNRRIQQKTIRSWIEPRKGDSYSSERLDQAIRALFETEHFSDVKVYAEEGVHGGKIVTFEVTERPLIQEIVYEGIDQASQDNVREEWRKQGIDLSVGSEYDPLKARRAAAVIKHLLVERGERRAKVNAMVERRSPTDVSIVFKVEE